MRKAMSAARANGDDTGLVQYALQCMYFMLWVCFSVPKHDQMLELCMCSRCETLSVLQLHCLQSTCKSRCTSAEGYKPSEWMTHHLALADAHVHCSATVCMTHVHVLSATPGST